MSNMTDDERAIRKPADARLLASEAGDLDAVLCPIAKDTVFLVPGKSHSVKRLS
jgi:ketosteroid isomerase-like protein